MLTLLITGLMALTQPRDSVMWQMPSQAFDNPAVRQWMLPGTYSRGGASWCDSTSNRAVDPRLGDGHRAWSLDAATYLKYKTSTLWGFAGYANGKQYGLRWNETSDPGLLYPYLTVDKTGGDMSLEQYRFGGGYADHSGRWAWGAALSYRAGLYYRNVDPRPRNVTGLLSLSAGVAYRVAGPYYAGVSVDYSKYKQTNDIEFRSELGVEKIYHLLGPAVHYFRFAGTGLTSNYSGHTVGAGVTVFPSTGRGLSGAVSWHRFSFEKILTQLNKLPLVSLTDNTLRGQLTWLIPGVHSDLAVSLDGTRQCRRGRENLFGDAAAGVYPKIGSREGYRYDERTATLTLLWQWRTQHGLRAWVRPRVSIADRNEVYVKPLRQILYDDLQWGADGRLAFPVKSDWRIALDAGARVTQPVRTWFNVHDGDAVDPAGLLALERDKYAVLSHHRTNWNVGAGVTRAIDNRLALDVRGTYTRTAYADGIHAGMWTVALSVLF